jgi:hypothetical protein
LRNSQKSPCLLARIVKVDPVRQLERERKEHVAIQLAAHVGSNEDGLHLLIREKNGGSLAINPMST